MHFLRDKVTKLIFELGFKFNIEITATFIPVKLTEMLICKVEFIEMLG